MRSALSSGLLTSVPSIICFCKPFSCKAFPGKCCSVVFWAIKSVGALTFLFLHFALLHAAPTPASAGTCQVWNRQVSSPCQFIWNLYFYFILFFFAIWEHHDRVRTACRLATWQCYFGLARRKNALKGLQSNHSCTMFIVELFDGNLSTAVTVLQINRLRESLRHLNSQNAFALFINA